MSLRGLSQDGPESDSLDIILPSKAEYYLLLSLHFHDLMTTEAVIIIVAAVFGVARWTCGRNGGSMSAGVQRNEIANRSLIW